MTEDSGRVAVIGGGPAGVCAVKCCLDEGLIPTCYEQHDDIGGTWYYTDHVRPNQGAGSYEKLITNTSKEMSCFSDFQMPEDYPQFVSVHQYHKYLDSYADHFQLKKYIRLNHSVVKVSPAAGFKENGKWILHVRESENDQVIIETFDHVMVSTGLYRKPKSPVFKGSDSFKGKIMHMHEYRTRDMFVGKKVVIVGNQTSAAEAAIEVSSVSKPVWMSIKHNFYFAGRFLPNGLPGDVGLSRHAFSENRIEETLNEFRGLVERSVPHCFKKFIPKELPFQGGCWALADGLEDLLQEEQLFIKPQIDYLIKDKVVFKDGSVLEHVDIVLLATGYLPDYDIVDIPGVTGIRDRIKFDLYLWMFPISLERMTLSVMNLTPLYQSQWTVIELQARLAARVFSGRHQLPDCDVMRKSVKEKRRYFMSKCGGKFQIVPVQYQEELAKELGVQPSFWRLFWMNPLMAYRCYYGPAIPIIYRLVGPGWQKDAWKGYHESIRRMMQLPDDTPGGTSHWRTRILLFTSIITGISLFAGFSWKSYR